MRPSRAWALALIIILSLLGIAACSEHASQKLPQGATSLTLHSSVVSSTEDAEALGYPGSRKLVEVGDTYYLAYRAKYAGVYHIYVSKSLDTGTSWQTANGGAPISDPTNKNSQRVPSLAAGPDGALHLVWYGADVKSRSKNERQIWYARSLNGGATWSPPANISNVPGYGGQELWQEHPTITIGPDGTIYVTWEGLFQTDSYRQLKLVTSTDGGSSWSAAGDVSSSAANQSRPSLVMLDADTFLVMAYATNSGGKAQVVSTRCLRQGGIECSEWTALSDPVFDSRHVSALYSEGAMWAVWRASASAEKSHIEVSRSTDGVTSTRPEMISCL